MFIVGEMMSFDTESMRFISVDQDAKVVPDPSLRDIKPTDIGKRRDNRAKMGDDIGRWSMGIQGS